MVVTECERYIGTSALTLPPTWPRPTGRDHLGESTNFKFHYLSERASLHRSSRWERGRSSGLILRKQESSILGRYPYHAKPPCEFIASSETVRASRDVWRNRDDYGLPLRSIAGHGSRYAVWQHSPQVWLYGFSMPRRPRSDAHQLRFDGIARAITAFAIGRALYAKKPTKSPRIRELIMRSRTNTPGVSGVAIFPWLRRVVRCTVISRFRLRSKKVAIVQSFLFEDYTAPHAHAEQRIG